MSAPNSSRAGGHGNIVLFEHVNLTVPDQELAALFYVTGLGFTRDPYIDFGTRNMWVNAGEQQFHLPKAGAQIFAATSAWWYRIWTISKSAWTP